MGPWFLNLKDGMLLCKFPYGPLDQCLVLRRMESNLQLLRPLGLRARRLAGSFR